MAVRSATVLLLASSTLALSAPLLLLPPLSRSIFWAYIPEGLRDASAPYLRLDDRLPGLLPACGLLVVAAWVTGLGIQLTMEPFKERGFKGKDLLKPYKSEAIPETMGLPSACLYLLLLFLFIPCRYFVQASNDPRILHMSGGSKLHAVAEAVGVGMARAKEDMEARLLEKGTEGGAAIDRMDFDGGWNGLMSGRMDFPHHEVAAFLSALLSLLSATMLGFLDDVFDIRWRYKIPIPIISSIPLLVVYYAGGGGTHVVVPSILRPLLPGHSALLDLGALYYVYISLLATFCTNSINILAGINGVEVGQALVIALSLGANDLLYLDTRAGEGGSNYSVELVQRHLFSLYLLLPFIGTCIGLLYWNRYPSRVFVGDTFCYFAGQVLACVGILGHFSKTLLLFFLPQIFNFILSCPQLFGLVPCPRHRLPRIDPESLQLYPSSAAWPPGEHASSIAALLLSVFEKLHFVRLQRSELEEVEKEGQDRNDKKQTVITGTTNLTILNAILVLRGVTGPMDKAGDTMLGKQVRTSSSSKSRKASLPHVHQSLLSGAPIESSEKSANGSQDVIESVRGPRIGEQALWWHLMFAQVIGSTFAFGVRYYVASVLFPQR